MSTINSGASSPGTPLNAAELRDFRKAQGFSDPGVFYVASDGDDTNGNGTIAAPFATAQKAYDVARALDADSDISMRIAGNVGSLVATDAPSNGGVLNLTLIGIGRLNSRLTTISGSSGYVRGNGVDMLSVQKIDFTSPNTGTFGASGGVDENGGLGGDGGAPIDVEVSGIYVDEDIHLMGAAGGEGGLGGIDTSGDNGMSGGNGGNGGAGGTLTLVNCSVADAVSQGGAGGHGGNGGVGGSTTGLRGNGGNGGTGGALTLINTTVRNGAARCTGGIAGDGTIPGNAGYDGAGASLRFSDVNLIASPSSVTAICGSIVAATFYTNTYP